MNIIFMAYIQQSLAKLTCIRYSSAVAIKEITLSHQQKHSTRAVHDGVSRQKKAEHSITTPIVQSATFTFSSTADLTEFMHEKVWGSGTDGREEYGRYGNPTILAVERKLAALEGTDDALLFASGMAGITTVLLASLPAGAHIVMTDDCYRRTVNFAKCSSRAWGLIRRLSRWAMMMR
jgi:cystathionine gamma-synthase